MNRRRVKYTAILLSAISGLLYIFHYRDRSNHLSNELYRAGQNSRLSEVESVQPPKIQCNDGVTWAKDSLPITGLLGAPGSGLLWLRAIIEQLTGYYSGSVFQDFPKEFKGEGKKDGVLTVMSYDAHRLPEMQAGIILYRSIKDSVQSDYITRQYYSSHANQSIDDFNADYDVARWREFIHHNINEWEETYRLYFGEKIPYLVIKYDNLIDPEKLKFELYRIARYLGVHPMDDLIDCVSQNARYFKFRPVKLNLNFDAYDLLLWEDIIKMDKFEKYIKRVVDEIYAKADPSPVGQNQVLLPES